MAENNLGTHSVRQVAMGVDSEPESRVSLERLENFGEEGREA